LRCVDPRCAMLMGIRAYATTRQKVVKLSTCSHCDIECADSTLAAMRRLTVFRIPNWYTSLLMRGQPEQVRAEVPAAGLQALKALAYKRSTGHPCHSTFVAEGHGARQRLLRSAATQRVARRNLTARQGSCLASADCRTSYCGMSRAQLAAHLPYKQEQAVRWLISAHGADVSGARARPY
jgi:hypothetical protein